MLLGPVGEADLARVAERKLGQRRAVWLDGEDSAPGEEDAGAVAQPGGAKAPLIGESSLAGSVGVHQPEPREPLAAAAVRLEDDLGAVRGPARALVLAGGVCEATQAGASALTTKTSKSAD